LWFVFSGTIALTAQTRLLPRGGYNFPSSYPEQAYLSASRYVSQYFDFSFEFPSELRLTPMAQPAARDGSIPCWSLPGRLRRMLRFPSAQFQLPAARTRMRRRCCAPCSIRSCIAAWKSCEDCPGPALPP